MNCELPDVQAEFRKGRGIRDQIANIHWIITKTRDKQDNFVQDNLLCQAKQLSWTKKESSRKTPISALLTMPKPLTVWITINCGKF